jgi:hypothetical protein
MWRSGVRNEEAQEISDPRTFEPLLAGDRQTEGCVAKARNALKMGTA